MKFLFYFYLKWIYFYFSLGTSKIENCWVFKVKTRKFWQTTGQRNLSNILLVLGIDTFFGYRYFSIPRFDTKFRYRYFSIPDHDTHFKNRYFSIPSFDTNLRYRYLKYRYPLRYFSIPSKYLKFVQANSAKQILYFSIKINQDSSMKLKYDISDF